MNDINIRIFLNFVYSYKRKISIYILTIFILSHLSHYEVLITPCLNQIYEKCMNNFIFNLIILKQTTIQLYYTQDYLNFNKLFSFALILIRFQHLLFMSIGLHFISTIAFHLMKSSYKVEVKCFL